MGQGKEKLLEWNGHNGIKSFLKFTNTNKPMKIRQIVEKCFACMLVFICLLPVFHIKCMTDPIFLGHI